jgi:hypothetical protein
MTEYLPLTLALADAANNCMQQGATATITLKSGVQLVGKLNTQKGVDMGSRHIETEGGGWITFLVSEAASVGVEPRQRF